ncbi:MAG: histidine kinase [Holophagaceae bacterium]|nr:histidine kinase [Holophagaceae bacterium]
MVLKEPSHTATPAATQFAPAERATPEQLHLEAEACLGHPVVQFLLRALDGLVLILNPERQILATNARSREVSDTTGVPVLGYRPGELFGCIHANEGPGGCGTSSACAHCGAVLAILEAGRTGQPVQSECLMSLRKRGQSECAEFRILASPLTLGDHRFTGVILHDLSALKRREVLERLFLHDVANLMQGIRSWADLLVSGAGRPKAVAQKLAHLTDLLDRELKGHQAMLLAEHGRLKPRVRAVLPLEILQDVADLLRRHALASERRVVILPTPEGVIHTDPELLSRVVQNMAINAVEASFMGEAITLSARVEGSRIRFLVHNPGEIPKDIRSRIFLRSFSTKGSPGRGLGTYAMKLFGENVLQGQVGYDTGSDGTTFWIRIAR